LRARGKLCGLSYIRFWVRQGRKISRIPSVETFTLHFLSSDCLHLRTYCRAHIRNFRMHDLRPNDEVLEEYIYTPFWESDEAESLLLSKDCILEFPFSPPGMPKSFPREKRSVLVDWLRRTVKSWSREDVVKYPTSDASRYWIESRTKAMVKWGGEIERQFDCTHIELVIIQDSKISTVRTWSDPLAYYRGIGVNLPVFHFDGIYSKGKAMADRPTKIFLADEEKAIAVSVINSSLYIDLPTSLP
jgi:hypothetical protein